MVADDDPLAMTSSATETDSGGTESPMGRRDGESEARTAAPAVETIGIKRRKSTYEARKEEKAELLRELEKLRARVQELEQQTPPSWSSRTTTELQRSLTEHALLHHGIREHNHRVAGLQSMVSGLLMNSTRSPLETYIHLPVDRSERRRILESLCERKLDEALAFARERSRFLDLSRRHRSGESFDYADGALGEITLHASVLEGVRSVKTVFDAMLHFFSHQEISISEALGIVTVREDDDMDLQSSPVSQYRLVTSAMYGQTAVEIESNLALFSRFVEPSGDHMHPFGIITTDSIDRDDLYPYRPKTTALDGSTTLDVSLLRWANMRASQHPGIDVPRDAVREIMQQWCSAMPQIIEARVRWFDDGGTSSSTSM